MKMLVFVLGLSALTLIHASGALSLLEEAKLSNWSHIQWHGQTDYQQVMDLEQGVVIRAHSQGSASGFELNQSVDLTQTPTLHWLWTVERFPFVNKVGEDGLEKTLERFDESKAGNNDFAVRLTVGTSAFFGPAKQLHYVWSAHHDAGHMWPLGPNEAVFVVNGQESNTLIWQTNRQNLSADWKKAFGEEVTTIDFIRIMTDTDDTQGQAIGYFGDIHLLPDSAR